MLPGCTVGNFHADSNTDPDEPPTWVRIPADQWPDWWKESGIRDPTCFLVRAVEGHPRCSIAWEKLSFEAFHRCVFAMMSGWECLFVNYESGIALSAYVDDFKMAGLKEHMTSMWTKLQQYLEPDPPEPITVGFFSEADTRYVNVPSDVIAESTALWPQLFRKVEKNVCHLHADVKAFLAGSNTLRAVLSQKHPIWGAQKSMVDFAHKCVERYCELIATTQIIA